MKESIGCSKKMNSNSMEAQMVSLGLKLTLYIVEINFLKFYLP